jgi:hypothetical protein
MNISDYEWVGKVSAKNLSSTSLVFVTKFTRHVRRLNGRVLSMSDPLLFRNMVEEIIITDDSELARIFDLLLVDIKRIAIKSGLEVPKNLLVQANDQHTSGMDYRGVSVK